MCGLQRFPPADVMDRLGNHRQLAPWYVPYRGLQGRGGAAAWHVLTPATPAAAHQLHPCSSESCLGLSLSARWKSGTCQVEQSAHGDRCFNRHSGAGYDQTPSPSMCLIPLPSQALHSHKEKEQVWAQIWPNEQHRCTHGSGVFSA